MSFNANSLGVFEQYSLHSEFLYNACTMKRMAVVNLLGTAGLINHCNIATASSHRISWAALFCHTQEASQFITVSFTKREAGENPAQSWKDSNNGSCPLSKRSHCHHSCIFPYGLLLHWPQLSRSTEHIWVSYSVNHLQSMKNQTKELRKLEGR